MNAFDCRVRLAVSLACGLLLLSGCGRGFAKIPEGCYRASDNQPILKVKGHQATVLVPGNLRTFKIGPWTDKKKGEFKTVPAFVLHDGTATLPRGPSKMFLRTETLQWGWLEFRQSNKSDILSIPLEAYGSEEVVQGAPC